jgi:hypothetical protein
MALAGMARAPWAVTTVVSCLPVLVLGMGTALAHMLRADAEAAGTPGCRTGPASVLRSLSWSPRDQARPGRRGPAAGQDRSVRGTRTVSGRDHATAAGSRTWPAARAAAGGPGLGDRPEAGHGREAGLTPGAAQRRAEGLEPTRP